MDSPFSKKSADKYLIRGAELWTGQEVRSRVCVRVHNGRLVSIEDETDSLAKNSDEIEIQAQNRVLIPAGVDAQVHLRVPGQGHKETPKTGLLAALKGGYSAVLTMPNTQPTIDDLDTLRLGQSQVAEFERLYGVHVFWSAAITKRLNSEQVTSFEDLVREGVRAFTNDGLGVESDQVMAQAFQKLESLGVPLLQHAEFLGHGGSLAPGPVQAKVGAKAYPDEPEWKMVERDIRELRKYPRSRYHVLHVSSRHTLKLVARAKEEGLNVTAEVSPHHLFFNCETIDPDNKSFKMNPPIRGPEDQAELWGALKNGTVDFVATDHAPHEELVKSSEFNQAAFGTIGLETTLPVLLYGLNRGLLDERRLVEVFATSPARFLRLPPQFGQFVIGEPFHGILVDVHSPPHLWKSGDFSSLSQNSCFIGSRLPGKIERAFHSADSYIF